MAFVQLAEGELHYQLDGPANAPVLVLSNSLGTDLQMWDAQIAAFSKHFRVLRFDTRGHGKSLVTPGPYSIEQLGHDVLALLDALHIDKAHFCGLSMGGLIGQWLGIHAGERLNKLVVCNTAAKIGDPSIWNPRIETVLRDGAAAMVALRDADFREQLSSIKAPLLVIAGTEDAVTPPSGGHFIQEHVQGAEYAEFYAAHLSNVQADAAFSERVLAFLNAH